MVPMSNREVTGSLFERNGCYTAVLNLYDKKRKTQAEVRCPGYSDEGQQAQGPGPPGGIEEGVQCRDHGTGNSTGGVPTVCGLPAGVAENHGSHH